MSKPAKDVADRYVFISHQEVAAKEMLDAILQAEQKKQKKQSSLRLLADRMVTLKKADVDPLAFCITLNRKGALGGPDPFTQLTGNYSMLINSMRNSTFTFYVLPSGQQQAKRTWLLAQEVKQFMQRQMLGQVHKVVFGLSGKSSKQGGDRNNPTSGEIDLPARARPPREVLRGQPLRPYVASFAPAAATGSPAANVYGKDKDKEKEKEAQTAGRARSNTKMKKRGQSTRTAFASQVWQRTAQDRPRRCERCAEVMELKKKTKSLKKLLDKVSWEEFAHHTTWDEFKSACLDRQFYLYAELARDKWIVDQLSSTKAPVSVCNQCEFVKQIRASTANLQEFKAKVTTLQFAHHTTWEEFKESYDEKAFKLNAHFARDTMYIRTTGFQQWKEPDR
eukprot:NODE_1161_length_1444_cov_73.185270_g1150_i0.p1 GENE.NODE_1161_length_1444_cov_73.185270_g1150_i0~~NODE_1161_length_1444_cov_73.185270_g1150_i0.p1  ORF type:complete len:438 (-),score=128.11 NODE_1161_length_1444_cov_73.185270_g1150_i0:129-1307(-)